ncbi:DUF4198 domain-containing protein [Maridesulfovibrio sp.]|uniref:DUF4198 domain-containing protein n=1 Tax=Maridesulfovibrio sp. TaxID=2795000 RepID=UPI0039F106FE
MMKKTVLAMVLVMAFASICSAHDMWLENKGRKAFLMYGHPGATDPYPLSRITAMTGISENNWKTSLEPVYNKGGAFAWLDDDYTMLTVEFDNRYWYHTEEAGWENFDLPRQVCGRVIDEGRSYKLSKTIIKWTHGMDKPIGQRAEIVPLKDPTKLKEGDSLPVMMYFEGMPMPAAGARISVSSDRNIEHPELVSLKESKPVNVKIGPAGRQVIIGKYEKRIDDIRRVWYAFSLSFRTGK